MRKRGSRPVTSSRSWPRSAGDRQQNPLRTALVFERRKMAAMNAPVETAALDDPLVIAGRASRSRLLVGTGKYRDFVQTRQAVAASGAQIVTVAIRRTNIGQDAGAPSLIDALPPSEFTYLPNSAGCYTADDAVRTLKLARELLDGHALTKLEVLGDKETLYPNVRETLKAAATLVADCVH